MVTFYYPRNTRAISVTQGCQQECKHCNGSLLGNMGLGNKPRYTSVLVSGGFVEGRVPLIENMQLLKSLKKQYKINAHIGLIPENEMKQLSFIDAVSFDFVGDSKTIKEVYNLDKTVDDYVKTYITLKKYVRVVPHVCIGLNGGKIGHEKKALKCLKKLGAEEIIFIIFRPVKGTDFEKKNPPEITDVQKIFTLAKGMFPKITLGCIRPFGKYRAEADVLAIEHGFNVVNPAKLAIEYAAKKGLRIQTKEECCAL